MMGNWYIMLAAEDGWEDVLKILLPIIFVVVGVLASVISKIKGKYERERAEQQEKEYEEEYRSGRQQPPRQQGQRPARRPTPVEEAVAAVRRVLSGEAEETEAEPEPSPAEPPRVAEADGPRRGMLRPAEESRLGEGVRGGVGRMERGLAAQDIARRKRLGRLEQLQPSIPGAAAGVEREAQRRIRVELKQPRDALAAIVYAEILGLPKALRRSAEPWDR